MLDCSLVKLGYSLGLLGYTVVRMGCILVRQGTKVPSLDSLEHIADLMANVPEKVHGQARVRMLTLQVILVIQVEDSKRVNILEIIHLHRCLKVKILVLQESCHFPFLVTMGLLHRLE